MDRWYAAFPRCSVTCSTTSSHRRLTSARAHEMRIDGFPILWFDNDADRQRAHVSPEMATCNVDSRSFIGAVSRVICDHRSCCRRRVRRPA